MGHKTLLRASIQAPAAGADFSWSPSTADPFRAFSLVATLTTSSGAANRVPDLIVKDKSGDVIWRESPGAVQTATLAVVYCWYVDAVASAFAANLDTVNQQLPDVWLPEGSTIASLTANLQSGDAWSAITASYHVWNRWEHDKLLAEIAEAVLAQS